MKIMIDYLKRFNFKDEELAYLKNNLSNEILLNLDIMQDNVISILTFLKEYGVFNIYNVVKYRPDLCFKDKIDLEKDLTILDKELILFIFNNDIDDLINFNI